jgi:putative oxidoreductase
VSLLEIKLSNLSNQFLLDSGLLVLRIFVAQEFLHSGFVKLTGGIHAPEWFAELSFPFPINLIPADMNWVIAGTNEFLFGLLILLGVYTRIAGLALLFIIYVAVYSVHFDFGWAGWNIIETDDGQGFKVPLMLAIMVFTIITQGPGRFSFNKNKDCTCPISSKSTHG